MIVCSVLLAGCTSEESNANTINVNEEKSNVDTINVANKETPKMGTLEIKSNPSGAKILVNNEFKGVTPLDLTLKEGTYNIKITKDDYEDYATSITIKDGGTKTINAELEETIKTGTLTINSEPSVANIYVNGKYRGITPLTLTLEPGTYTIKISKDGYKTYTKTVIIDAKEVKSISAPLEKIQIGTYENPAKIGDVIRLKSYYDISKEVGGFTYIQSHYNTYDVSVDKYIRGDDAENYILYSNDLKNGYEHLLIHVKVKLVSGEHAEYFEDNFEGYCDGTTYKHEWDYILIAKNEKLFGGYITPHIEETFEREGWISFKVPKNEDVLIKYIPPGEGATCYFKLN